jgi:hypothetical protein
VGGLAAAIDPLEDYEVAPADHTGELLVGGVKSLARG